MRAMSVEKISIQKKASIKDDLIIFKINSEDR